MSRGFDPKGPRHYEIRRVDAFVVKVPHHDRFGGQVAAPLRLGDSDYYFEDEWREIYAVQSQSTLVRIETQDGTFGWGECQAPILPEVAGQIVTGLLGPMLLGQDPRAIGVLRKRMYESMNVRGQTTGFMLDAISGLDIALWDVKGKLSGEPIARLLGGPFRMRLPAYVSGLRAPGVSERADLAASCIEDGYAGVKLYLGRGVIQDVREVEAAREKLPDGRLFSDLFWLYDLPSAIQLGRKLQELGVEWLESPLHPEDVRGHAELAAALDVAIAVGEPLRTDYQFLPWLESGALDIAQPDVARSGITGARRIADLADAFHKPVAYHLGVCLGIGMVATWHLAAATGNFLIQEHEPPMLELSNRFLDTPLRMEAGELVVPDGPGLGVDVDEAKLAEFVTWHGSVG